MKFWQRQRSSRSLKSLLPKAPARPTAQRSYDNDSEASIFQMVAAGVGSALVTALIALFIYKIKYVFGKLVDVFNYGAELFAPGQLFGDQAYVGFLIACACLAGIGIAFVVGRRRDGTLIMTAVFTAVGITAIIFAFAVFQQFRGFLPIA